ncbi:hypothetical protein Moror_607 [Moniliophthora roreri MCA 2997]|nr:hypothetical protein Moror_607 [Moniliophthora roreri MCA 2997]
MPSHTLATSTNTSFFDPVTGECTDINGCRMTTGILWSCFSVTFICTWVAIHPNIPLVTRNSTTAVIDNIILMVIALLAPELIILWAMRQWFSANRIARQFKKYGWGKTHAFFVLMGGFALYDGDDFCGYLWEKPEKVDRMYWEQIASRHQKVQEDFPPHVDPHSNVTVDQAHDSNRASSSEKEPLKHTYSEPTCLLEFLVANGFIRISEDEIKDRSHADILSKSIALIQATWFLMQVAARAFEGLAVTELEIMTVAFALLNFGTYFFWWNKPLRVRHPYRVYWQQREYHADPTRKASTRVWTKTIRDGLAQVLKEIYLDTLADGKSLVLQLALLPLFIIWHISTLSSFVVRTGDSKKYEFVERMFCSRLPNDSLQLHITIYAIAAVFGAIHCIPWAFHFPTHTEQLLWRICAISIAAAPIAMGAVHLYNKVLNDLAPRWLNKLVRITTILLSMFYIFSRVALIFLAFTALRDLSPSAYKSVQWTTLIPHIG